MINIRNIFNICNLCLIGCMSLYMPVSEFNTANAEAVFLKGSAYKSGITKASLTVGMSEVLMSNEAIKRVSVTDPSIADLRVLSDTSILVRGKRVGKTSLIIWEGKDANDSRPQRFDLTVKRDIEDLMTSLKALDPNINIDYVIVQSTEVLSKDQESIASSAYKHNGAYTQSFTKIPERVGDNKASLLMDRANDPSENFYSYDSSEGGQPERLILTGKVRNPEIIAKAMSIAMSYMGEEDNSIKITTRSGGFIVEHLESNGILSGSGGGGGGNQISDILDNTIKFDSNLTSNLANSSIVTSGSGQIVSMLEVDTQAQIAVKARFYEVNKSRAKNFKINGSRGGSNSLISTGAASGTVNNTGFGLSVDGVGRVVRSILTGGASVAGGTTAVFNAGEIILAMEALEKVGAAKVLSEPTIVVKNGEPGKFRVGGEIPLTTVTTSNTATQSGVNEYIPYGVMLNILPTLNSNDSVLMNVNAMTRDIDAVNSTEIAPAFLTRKVETQVEMDPGQALILAGLINANSSQQLTKLPILGDVPLLGSLFRSKGFDKEESELVIVLIPELVRPTHFSNIKTELQLEEKINDNEFTIIPDGSQFLRRTDVHINAPATLPPSNGPADLRMPTTLNDLDSLYR